jgi:hypothetical protein
MWRHEMSLSQSPESSSVVVGESGELRFTTSGDNFPVWIADDYGGVWISGVDRYELAKALLGDGYVIITESQP